MNAGAAVPLVLAGAVLTSCSSDERPPVLVEPPDRFRDPSSLQCLGDRTSGLVVDHVAGAVGSATPELAAEREVPAERVAREGWTRRTTTDATGAVFVDHLAADGRLVLYVRPRQQPDGTWLVEQVSSCEDG